MKAGPIDALPRSCFHPLKIHDEGQLLLFAWRVELLKQLRDVMTDEEIISASNGEQPALDKMKLVTCKSCRRFECPLNPRHRLSDGLSDMMNGQYADRIKVGDELLRQLLPEEKKKELKQRGVNVDAFQMPSRKNPRLVFSFTRGGNSCRVGCEIGTRRLWTHEGDEALISLEQLSKKIEGIISAFT